MAVIANGYACDACGDEYGWLPGSRYGDLCMNCVKARARAAMDGRCHCGRKAVPGSERGGNGRRSWIPCERCLGTIRQTG